MADTQVPNSQIKPNHSNPSKFYTRFLYKSLIVTIFLVLLQLLPSQPPEFINQTLHTRSWELLHLIFVGIAVSYGLFSKRNDETEKTEREYISKFDNAQSFVSRLLQISSVFDNVAENQSVFDENKVQTWSSQYYRGESVLMVAEKSSVFEEQRDSNSRIGEKSLLLPIRSLKSCVFDSDMIESTNESSVKIGSISNSSSNSSLRRFSNDLNKSRNGELGEVSPLDFEKMVEESFVLPSPIPWKSKSGRIEMKEGENIPPLYSLPNSSEDLEVHQLGSRSFKSQSSRYAKPNSISPSPKKLSPSPSQSSWKNPSHSPSLSPEIQVKNTEILMRKKSVQKASPPLVPPPPPFLPKSELMKLNSSLKSNVVYVGNKFKQSIPNLESGLKPRTQIDGTLEGQSVMTIRGKGFSEDYMNRNRVKKSKQLESNFKEKREYIDKSMREISPVVSKQNFSDFPKEEVVVVVVETDDDSESEVEYFEGCPDSEEVVSNSVRYEGPDVDKKADEFIAKFREQIRLQRIESIRKSTGQPARKTV